MRKQDKSVSNVTEGIKLKQKEKKNSMICCRES